MANHLKGEVEIEAAGRKWTLRLGCNEMIEAEAALGVDDGGLGIFLEQNRRMKNVRAVVFYALKRDQPEVTEEQAGDIITEIGLHAMMVKVLELFTWALPEKKPGIGGEKGGAPKPRPSVGPTPS